MTKTALILVDIQNDYFPGGGWPVAEMDRAAENAAKLLQKARIFGDLVVHIRHETGPQAPFFRPGTAGAEIHPSVAPTDGETVLTKHRPNSFHGTPLKDLLDQAGITRVVLCGAQSQMCIDATTRAAVDFGLDTVVIEDACAAKEAQFGDVTVPAEMVHAAFMSPLAMSYATVLTTDAFLTS